MSKNKYTEMKSLFETWMKYNELSGETLKRKGNRPVVEYTKNRSVEELTLSLDTFCDGLTFFIAMYHEWRNRPTRRGNEELKASLGFIRNAYIQARKTFVAIDRACVNTNFQYALENQRNIISIYKESGIEAVKELYDQNKWPYEYIVEEYLKGINRKTKFERTNVKTTLVIDEELLEKQMNDISAKEGQVKVKDLRLALRLNINLLNRRLRKEQKIYDEIKDLSASKYIYYKNEE